MDDPKQLAFEAALRWHQAGLATSSLSQSVYYTQTILNELNEAIELLNSPSPISPASQSFLTRHTGAPY